MAIRFDQPFCLLGAQALLQHLQEFMGPVGAVRRGRDMDAIHDVRVASRRLRSGLAIFEPCLPAGKVKRWKKQFRNVTQALGQARDLEVQILFLEDHLRQTRQKTYRLGVERLVLRVRQHRDQLQQPVLEALDSLESTLTVPQMEQVVGQMLAAGKLDEFTEHTRPEFKQAKKHITRRLKDMLALEPFVLQPDRIAEHHEMRKMAKHLRYTMEYFQPLFEGGLDEAITNAHKIQRMLGEIHDCDVWVEYLARFMDEETARIHEFFGDPSSAKPLEPGIHQLREDRRRRRAKLYREFVRFWQQLAEKKFWILLEEKLMAADRSSKTNSEAREPRGTTR